MAKKILMLMLAVAALFFFSSCDIGNYIVDIKLGNFPDNIVYYVDESKKVDLDGGTVICTTLDGRLFEEPMTTYEVTDNIDFSTPGVYEVNIMHQLPREKEPVIIRIPVQVIERG